MDFFAEQDRARRNTRRLLLLFVLAVLTLIVLTNLVVAGGLWAMDERVHGAWEYTVNAPALDGAAPPVGFLAYLSLPLFLGIGAVVSGSVALASGYRHLQLAKGGAVVAQMLGGSPLDPSSRAPAERRLLNVVEEMAIASGVPVPRVYRVPGEGINAFAAGYTINDAVIGVTDGALAELGRDELQGVIGHEFSHILNGDMRLNLRLIAVLYGILFIAQAGRVLLDSQRGGRDRNAGAILGIGIALVVLGSAGVFFGRLIKAGVSREREFLADAAAVQFTRNPLGLADALRRIGARASKGVIDSPRAEEASHLFFAQAIAARASSWFATHPPLEKRIRRLDPAWDGRFQVTRARAGVEPTAPPALDIADEDAPGAVASLAGAAGVAAAASAPASVGPHPGAVPIAGLSGALRAACRGADSAAGVVLGALIDARAGIAARQYELLARHGIAPPQALEAELVDAPVVPVLELAMPALAGLDDAASTRLWGVVEELIAVDGHLDLREITAAVLLQRQLCPQSGLARATRPRYRRLEQVAGALSVLLSALAGAEPDGAAARFAAAGEVAALSDLRLQSQPDWRALAAALAELRCVFPLLKPRVLKACRAALPATREDDPNRDALPALLATVLDCPAAS